MYAFAIGGQVLFEEVHEDAPLINGYYAIMVGSIEPLAEGIFQNAEVFFGLKVNDGDELRPLTPIAKVPAAMVADTATNAIGDITPKTVSIGGVMVINAEGKWVGDPGGLRGPPGQDGAAGERGPQGEAGPATATGHTTQGNGKQVPHEFWQRNH